MNLYLAYKLDILVYFFNFICNMILYDKLTVRICATCHGVYNGTDHIDTVAFRTHLQYMWLSC